MASRCGWPGGTVLVAGTAEQVGRLSGFDCVAVLFPDRPCASVYRLDQVRPWREGMSDLQTAREPLGGLFAGGGTHDPE